MARIFLWILSLLLLSNTVSVSGYCSGSTVYATTYSKSISNYYYSSYEDCTYYIRPQTSSVWPSSSYYLEITWSTFKVNGELPYCSTDYVEVFLTRYVVSYNFIWQIYGQFLLKKDSEGRTRKDSLLLRRPSKPLFQPIVGLLGFLVGGRD